ncbi:MAG: phosphate transport system permease protein PstA [Nitrospirales bacterium]|nr:MAG: phosphate transport system permease protein PstA [Nitrospirales bacterium]
MDKHVPYTYDMLPTTMIWTIAGLIGCVFLWLLGSLIWQGTGHLSWEFLTTPPADAGRSGGINSILVSTALLLLVCMAVVFPIGLGTAIFLAEFTSETHPLAQCTGRSLDMLASIPSIVFGLFGNAFFCQLLGLGFSILSGGLTLACMVLPILVRTTEQGVRALPQEYRLSAAALGLTKRATLRHLLLPAAIPALVVGFVLGLGRAIAETAALIFTSGYVSRMPESLFDSGRALSIHIYDLSMNVPGGDHAAYSTALVLIICVLILNRFSLWISKRWMHTRIMIT